MKYLRNPEILKTLIVYLLITAVATVTAFIFNTFFGIFTLFLCLIFITVHLTVTLRRYKKFSELSLDIDRILHGENKLTLEKYSEGELGILQSEIHKMTVRLREQQDKLQKDKLYLADSIADISHQIRTPLTSINLLVSFLSEPDVSDERRLKLTHELYELLSRIDWLITALLKVSKLDAGTVQFKIEDISLEELISKSLSPLLIPIELKGQNISISALGTFKGDISWTCEAISNIVKNCTEHTPEGGTIKISACENALYTEIIIQDTGKGIAKEDLSHIFERFYKGKNSSEKSFGIGLNLARMIITAQNGTVKAENTTDGARFSLRFYKSEI